MVSLRERNRLSAMQLTQRRALDLFEERGFDEVTVSEIAEDVGMAPSTLYRHFATKEAIVLWDEHAAPIEEALVRELSRQPPLAAIRHVAVTEIGGRYDDDLEFQLRRTKYLYATEQLHAAAVEADYRDRVGLTEALEQVVSPDRRAAAPLLAGAALLAIEVAFDRWQQCDGERSLGELIDASFDDLAHLAELA